MSEKVVNSKEIDKQNLIKVELTNDAISGTSNMSDLTATFRRNCIFRSKTSKGIKNLKVKLQNIQPYLRTTQRFCDKCLILFPNKGSLNDHNLSLHSLLEHKQDDPLCPGVNTNYKCNVEENFDLDTNYVVRKACFHCNELFPNQQDLIDHLYFILYTKNVQDPTENTEDMKIVQEENPINTNNKIVQKNINMRSNGNTEQKINVYESKSVYSCPICSYYFNDEMFCKSHVFAKHNALKNMQINKSAFDSMCKFCDVKYEDILSYNSHLRRSHKNEMLKSINSVSSISGKLKGNLDNIRPYHLTSLVQHHKSQDQQMTIYNNIQVMVSKIILFKCSKCYVHFLTHNAAVQHLKHLKFRKNWECSNCQRLFKDKDAKTHLKQHKYSEYFEILIVQPTILYKCLRSAVHFCRENISKHSSVCKFEHPQSNNSSNCKVCDILIKTRIKPSHENDHNLKNSTQTDIKIINSVSPVLKHDAKNHEENCLDNQAEKPYLPDASHISVTYNKRTNITKKIGALSKKQLSYKFCNICKCNICTVFKTDVHQKSLCVNIVKYICKFCGLMFSNKTIISHKRLHQKFNTMKLQDLTFYNLQTKRIMKPLIPEFPKCELCEKHFISKVEVKGHVCGINDFICFICKTKFSETAYKLHMPFHTYRLKSKFVKRPVLQTTDKLVHKIISCDYRNGISKSMSDMDEIVPVIYTCKNCSVSLNTYDAVIEHCHLHTNLNKVEVNNVECVTCQLKFDSSSINKHVKFHKDFENLKFTRFNFDMSYFGSDKWIKHIYQSLSKDEVNKLIQDSIYKYENRIKMEVIQEGLANLTIYKCDRCQCVIDCSSTYSHIVNCCPDSEQSDCKFCDLSFSCSMTRNNHEKIHAMPGITVKSYRVVIFNREQDRNINSNISSLKKCYVLYECRFCHVLVEKCDYPYHLCYRNDCKKCNICGLLIFVEHFDDHIQKHKRLPSFNENRIKVVLLGNITEQHSTLQSDNCLIPTFNGIVCDYTFYKCNECEVCVRDVRNTMHHSCLIDAAKSQCTKCDLIFDEGKLKGHLKFHDSDPDFTKETILVKPFTNRKHCENVGKPKKLLPIEVEKICKSSTEHVNHIMNEINKKKAILYKCQCGLHYMHQSSLEKHVKKCSKNKTKQSIQNCSKCGFSFTSDVLFRHLIEHHGNKKAVFEYEIVENLRKEKIILK